MNTVDVKCGNIDETVEELARELDPSRRRGLLAFASSLVAGLAVLLEGTPASAYHECLGQPHCCDLATCRWCRYPVSRDRFNCSEWPGSYRAVWSCRENGRLAWCGECAGSRNCFQYPWKCSIWYWN